MTGLRTLLAVAAISGWPGLATPSWAQPVKTEADCVAEYATAKPAVDAAQETREDFLDSCRGVPVGMATPIGGSASPSPPPGYVPPGSRPSGPTK